MPEPTEVAAVLRKAADLIDERGLAKGRFVDSAGRMCAVGATAAVVGAHPTLINATEDQRALCEAADLALATYLCAGLPPACPEAKVSYWSDAPDTTAAKVSAAMRAAALEAHRG